MFNIENMNVLLFGKSKIENIEYFLYQISYEDTDDIINEEICKKIYFSCEADVLFFLIIHNLNIKLSN